MSKDQMQNEMKYQLSKELLTRMLFRNLITEEEYHQIDRQFEFANIPASRSQTL